MTCTLFRRRFIRSSRHTEFSLSACLGKLSGTVCKPCLIAFLELSSCLCMDESSVFNRFFCPADLLIYRRDLCMWSWVTCLRDQSSGSRGQPVSHVFNIAAARESSPSGCPNCLFSASLLQGHGLLARAARLESLPTLVPLQLPVLQEQGRVVLLCQSFHRRHHCMWSWATCLRDDASISLLDREAKRLPFHSHRHALHSSVGLQIDP